MENTNQNVEELFKPALSHIYIWINFKNLYSEWEMLMQIKGLEY